MTPLKPDISVITRKIAYDEVFYIKLYYFGTENKEVPAVYQNSLNGIVTPCRNETGKSRPGGGLPRRLEAQGGGQRPGEGGRAFVRRTWQGGGRAIWSQVRGNLHDYHDLNVSGQLRQFKGGADYKSVMYL
jgi:hypothetical protein